MAPKTPEAKEGKKILGAGGGGGAPDKTPAELRAEQDKHLFEDRKDLAEKQAAIVAHLKKEESAPPWSPPS
eukprot:SAG22_NODE_81_length_21778_cov_38.345173_9_plen_71_part_00